MSNNEAKGTGEEPSARARGKEDEPAAPAAKRELYGEGNDNKRRRVHPPGARAAAGKGMSAPVRPVPMCQPCACPDCTQSRFWTRGRQRHLLNTITATREQARLDEDLIEHTTATNETYLNFIGEQGKLMAALFARYKSVSSSMKRLLEEDLEHALHLFNCNASDNEDDCDEPSYEDETKYPLKERHAHEHPSP